MPDASIALHYMLVKFRSLLQNLVVDTERMKENLDSTRGLVFSQAVLLALVARGLSRDDAYRIVQRNAMRAWDEKTALIELLAGDDEVPLEPDELEECFSPERVLETSAPVFDRLAGLAQPRS
jgi:adenylosuccinate lyase